MSKFIKFPSIDNHYQGGATERWKREFPELPISKFAITEKLDGSNLQLIITADEVKAASRRHMLDLEESFFDYQRTVLINCKPQIEAIQKHITDNNLENVYVYGEIFGQGVQKRIDYCEGKQFLPFEVRIDNELISIKDARDLFGKLGISEWWVPLIEVVDSLDEALEFNVNKVPTRIVEAERIFKTDKELNKNIEGVVIAPYDKVFKRKQLEGNESVFRLKKKCKEFNDKMKTKTKELKVFNGSEEYNRLRNIWDGYFNENRLADLFSKEGKISEMREIGKYIKLMTVDVREDFLKDHKDAFMLLADDEKKQIMSSAGKNTLPLLQDVL